ncbi:preprotein translocase subunit SecA [Streptococcus cristatus]|uniref:Protein translocase subunit SecA n=2 Tax=Streptococcus cristatus TaxID=45634 RepID=A0A512AB11_STRCR|nr:accessory Sec system translocase SecA2 [Streptococcus cristatus]AGK71535.1 preprotein translocase subunit SecA [Streptococcus cristatus AS 1.3089]GEN96879.1 protein translocase subunit SecA [Streptococcus cristatus]SQI48266.1 preprotein translocase subunit SecA [Streptococcus cristatus]
MKPKKLHLANSFKLRRYKKILEKINQLSDDYAAMSDEELQSKTQWFKGRLSKGERLQEILPEAYATIREAAKRVLGLYPYDVQILGALIMQDNQIAEMRTGEGKTLTAILPLYLNALTGKSTILVTANEYLAMRDAKQMGPVFHYLGMTVGVGVSENPAKKLKVVQKQRIYQSDIVYTTHSALGFDYLEENLATSKSKKFLPKFYFCLVDEVDAALLDSAQMPLIISGSPRVQSNLFVTCDEFVKTLKEGEDFKLDSTRTSVWLTRKGVKEAEIYFRVQNAYDPNNYQLIRQINLALRANHLFEKDRQYTVDNGEVKLMDEGTGRLLEGNKLQSGLHQALEARERVKISLETRSMASITYQNLFKMFPKLAGMTGTGKVCEDEFREVYDLGVVVVPTRKPNQRIDYPDEIYLTIPQKLYASLDYIKKLHRKGQPVLIATGSVRMSEIYSMLLLQEGIAHNVLNAHNAAKEAEMIAQAGRRSAVTVATSMAGRGTDIILEDGVAKLGGLAVIGTERMSSERVDLQLRGRAGRQGAPGLSKFFVSLEDDIITKSGSKWINDFYQKEVAKPEEKQKVRLKSARVKFAVAEAQKNSDNAGAASRRSTEQYDESIRIQRQIIYNKRNDIIAHPDFDLDYFLSVLSDAMDAYVKKHPFKEQADLYRFVLDNISYYCQDIPKNLDVTNIQQVKKFLTKLFIEEYQRKRDRIEDSDMFEQFQRTVVLRAVDDCWVEQVDYLQQFQALVISRGYAQKNPVYEFHKEAFESYKRMNADMSLKIIKNMALSSINIQPTGKLEVFFG